MVVRIEEFALKLQDVLENDEAYHVRMNREACKMIAYAVCDTIQACLADGDIIKLSGFGTFSVIETKGRTYIHPITGEKHVSAPGKSVKFKPGKPLKDAVSGE